jgi:hypothetical protein
LPLFRQFVAGQVEQARKARAEIQSAPDDTSRAILEPKFRAIEGVVADVRVIGDAVLSAFFEGDKDRARETRRATIESWVAATPIKWDDLRAAAAGLRMGPHSLPPFHWAVEFPEVFARENPGFDAIVGNPPFGGKNTIIGWNRKNYLFWLPTLHQGAHGNSDLAAHFFRRAFGLLRDGGIFGLLGTNTIAQGDTRASGLEALLASSGVIYRATKRLKWPGPAAVVVSVVHMSKGGTPPAPVLDTSLDLLAGRHTLAPAGRRQLGDESRLLELSHRAQDLPHQDVPAAISASPAYRRSRAWRRAARARRS